MRTDNVFKKSTVTCLFGLARVVLGGRLIASRRVLHSFFAVWRLVVAWAPRRLEIRRANILSVSYVSTENVAPCVSSETSTKLPSVVHLFDEYSK